ncbi:MAG: isochorismate synthase [Acidimicrobiales bacterium]
MSTPPMQTPGGAPAELVAVRFPLGPGPAVDPFTLAGSDAIAFLSGGRVLVGLGCADTIALPHGLDEPTELDEAVRSLASIRCDDRVEPKTGAIGVAASDVAASGVMAFGALPFDRSAPAILTVPELIFGVEPSGHEWVTIVTTEPSRLPTGPEGLRSRLRARHGDRLRSPAGTDVGGDEQPGPSPSPRVTALSSDRTFERMVDEALAAIHGGHLSKVVLARQVEVTTGDAIDIADLLRRWHDLEPACTLFSLPGADGQFVGASPELLIERSGLHVESRPLAGTTGAGARPPGPNGEHLLPTELLASEKDGTEHRLVVEAIATRLGPLCSELDVPAGPDLVHLHSIVHLGTSLVGTLSCPARGRPPSALTLVGALHPTPAVGGVPTEAARSLIARLEPASRGRYAGPVGYVDAQGDGTWVLGIRAASVRDRTARLAAGVGIVDGSDPQAELAETNLKFDAVFDALAPGVRLAGPKATTGPRRSGGQVVTKRSADHQAVS